MLNKLAEGKPYLEISDLPAAQMTKEQLEASGLTQDAIKQIYNGELDAHFIKYPGNGTERFATIESITVMEAPMKVEGITFTFGKALYTVTYMTGSPVISIS